MVSLPFLIALFRIRSMDRQYIPFVVYLFSGVITEICSFIFISVFKKHNAEITNFYVLAEWFIILWQFYRWGLLARSFKKFWIIASIGFIAWFSENIIAGQLNNFGPYFRWLYSFVIVIMSINTVNYIITHDFRNLFLNARFIICLCFIIFFSYKIIYEWAFQLMSINKNIAFSNKIITFFTYLNAFVNVVYIVAVLFIPARRRQVTLGVSRENEKSLS